MNYNFPTINHIDDVKPYLKDKTEFIIAERDFGTVISYTHIGKDTFPDLAGPNDSNRILRECRGIMFDTKGHIMSRPFHKFFNLNERIETNMDNVVREFAFPHFMLEKLDGSMIRPVWFPNAFRLGTKMGITDTALNAENWLYTQNQETYFAFIHDMHRIGVTPIFEWCSRKNKIVIDYPSDRLVLLALRYNVSGEYVPYLEMKSMADMYNLDVVYATQTAGTVESWIQGVRNSKQLEGYVVRFNNGQMVKIKADWYVALHRTKDEIREEKNVLQLVLEEKIDDLLPLLDPNDREKVREYQHFVNLEIANIAIDYDHLVIEAKNKNADQKTFALEYAKTMKVPSIAFDIFSGKSHTAYEAVAKYCLKHCSSRTRIKELKSTFQSFPNYQEIEE